VKLRRRAFSCLFSLLAILAFSISCQKTYSVNPVSSSSGGSLGTPTSTPNYCQTLTPVPSVPSGIYWGQAFLAISNSSSGTFEIADVYLLVNGNPEATASVSIIGPGSTSPLAYNGNQTLNGVLYAVYQSTSIPYQAGTSWTMKTVTSIGTAYATMNTPGGGTAASDGSQVSWTYPGELNGVQVVNGTGTTTYTTNPCASVTSPAAIPASAYPASGTYAVSYYAADITTNIVGGAGIFFMEEADSTQITK